MTFSAVKIFAPPTGTSDVLPRGPDEVVVLLLLPGFELEPHAASRGRATPRPATPPTTARREGSRSFTFLFSGTDSPAGSREVVGSNYFREVAFRCCPLVVRLLC